MSLENMGFSPDQYVEAAVVAREAGEEMLARLEWMSLQPQVIVDMGCGSAFFSERLQQRYPQAMVMGLDHDENRLGNVTPKKLCADAVFLPLRDHSVDLIFANFLVPWCQNAFLLLREWLRVLRPNGLVMCTLLGVDTLKEWPASHREYIIPQRVDMHQIGDELLKQGFSDPVMEVEYYTLAYQSKEKLLQELIDSDMLSANDAACEMTHLQLTYEVIYAHAFAPSTQSTSAADLDPHEVRIPLSQLRRV